MTNTFMDAGAWESIRRKGEAVVKAWIDRELMGTGVTVVLIGTERDPQGLEHQKREFEAAGAAVFRSNAQAAREVLRSASQR